MALSKSSLFSSLRSLSQEAHLPRRGYHIDLGARERALLEEDPALKRFKSYKNTVNLQLRDFFSGSNEGLEARLDSS